MTSKEYAAILALTVFSAAPLCVYAEESEDTQDSSVQTYCFIHVREYWAGHDSPINETTYQVNAGDVWSASFSKPGYSAILTDASLNPVGTDASFISLSDISQDQTLYVVYVPDTASYTVEQHFYDLAGNEEKVESYTLSGQVDSLTEVEAPEVSGYSISYTDQEYVRADGSTIVRIRYDAAVYEINYHSAGTFTDAQEVSCADLQAWQTDAVSSRLGYIFEGWSYEENGTVVTDWNQSDLLAHAQNSVIDLYAVWSPDTVNYTVRFWIQNFTDDPDAEDENKTYGYVGSVIRQDKTESFVSLQESDISKGTLTDSTSGWYGLIYNSNLSSSQVEVLPDGTSTLNVYYDRAHVKYVFHALNDTSNIYLSSVPNSGTYDNVGETLSEYEGLYDADFYDLDTNYSWRVYSFGDGDHTSYDLWSEVGQFATCFGEAVKLDGTTYTIDFYRHAKLTSYKVNGYFYEQYDGTYRFGYSSLMPDNARTVTFTNTGQGYHYAHYAQVFTEQTTKAAKAVYEDPKYLNAAYWNNESTPVSSSTFVLSFANGNANVLAFNLDTYTLELNYNASELYDTFSVKYTTPLNEQWASDVYEAMTNPTRPENLPDYMEFEGWYLDKDYSIPFVSTEMPAANLVLYAKWVPATCTVTVHDRVNPAYSLTLEAGSQVMGLDVPDNGDSLFLGWYLDDDFSIPFAFDKQVVHDSDIYAKWKDPVCADTLIHYVDEFGHTLAEDDKASGTLGQYMAAAAKPIQGFSPVDLAKDVLMDGTSEITFVYKPIQSLWYQVQYVLEDGTLIAAEDISHISNLDTFLISANIPDGYVLANPDDQIKRIEVTNFSADPENPTLIQIPLLIPGSLKDEEDITVVEPEENLEKDSSYTKKDDEEKDSETNRKQDQETEKAGTRTNNASVQTAAASKTFWTMLSALSLSFAAVLRKNKRR